MSFIWVHYIKKQEIGQFYPWLTRFRANNIMWYLISDKQCVNYTMSIWRRNFLNMLGVLDDGTTKLINLNKRIPLDKRACERHSHNAIFVWVILSGHNHIRVYHWLIVPGNFEINHYGVRLPIHIQKNLYKYAMWVVYLTNNRSYYNSI